MLARINFSVVKTQLISCQYAINPNLYDLTLVFSKKKKKNYFFYSLEYLVSWFSRQQTEDLMYYKFNI